MHYWYSVLCWTFHLQLTMSRTTAALSSSTANGSFSSPPPSTTLAASPPWVVTSIRARIHQIDVHFPLFLFASSFSFHFSSGFWYLSAFLIISYMSLKIVVLYNNDNIRTPILGFISCNCKDFLSISFCIK